MNGQEQSTNRKFYFGIVFGLVDVAFVCITICIARFTAVGAMLPWLATALTAICLTLGVASLVALGMFVLQVRRLQRYMPTHP